MSALAEPTTLNASCCTSHLYMASPPAQTGQKSVTSPADGEFLSSTNRGFANQEMDSSSTALPGNWELSWHAGVFCGARFPRLAGKDGLFPGTGRGTGRSPHFTRRAYRTHAAVGSFVGNTHARASETAFVVASLGVARRQSPEAGSVSGFWSSARGRDAPEHMSTNATAAIAGPQGGGKAGGGGNGVSDSASVAGRCASTLGTRARRRVTTQPTHVATGFSPLTERRHPFSFLTPSQAAERADVPHGAYRARAPFLSRRQGKPHASWRPRAARTEPSSPRPSPSVFFQVFGTVVEPSSFPLSSHSQTKADAASAPSRTAITSSTGSGPLRVPRGRCVTPPTRSFTPTSRPPKPLVSVKTTTSGADARLARETFSHSHPRSLPSPRLFPQVYEGLTYKLSLAFPNDYPFKAPTVKFETPCFHPNVDQFGNICLDILKEKWSSVYDVRAVLLSIQSLLGEPNNASPSTPRRRRCGTTRRSTRKPCTRSTRTTSNEERRGERGEPDASLATRANPSAERRPHNSRLVRGRRSPRHGR